MKVKITIIDDEGLELEGEILLESKKIKQKQQPEKTFFQRII